jgi:hypothetical protein
MMKIVIIMLSILLSTYEVIYADNNELLILQDKIKLIVHPDKTEAVKELNKLEKVIIVNPTLLKNYINVKTEDGKIGWVLEKYTTFLTENWKEQKIDSLITIMLPKNQSFRIMKDHDASNKDLGIFVEKKMYNQNYFIYTMRNNWGLQKNLDNEMKDSPFSNTKPIITKTKLNDIALYYCDNLIDDLESAGSPLYFILFEGKNNICYRIVITLHQSPQQPEEYYLTAKKILFSAKMK